MTKTKYPECEKLHAVHEESQKIGEFIEWLRYDKGIQLGKYYTVDELNEADPGMEYQSGEFIAVYDPINKLLAEYFEIDLDKVEEERRQILEELRKANDEK